MCDSHIFNYYIDQQGVWLDIKYPVDHLPMKIFALTGPLSDYYLYLMYNGSCGKTVFNVSIGEHYTSTHHTTTLLLPGPG